MNTTPKTLTLSAVEKMTGCSRGTLIQLEQSGGLPKRQRFPEHAWVGADVAVVLKWATSIKAAARERARADEDDPELRDLPPLLDARKLSTLSGCSTMSIKTMNVRGCIPPAAHYEGNEPLWESDDEAILTWLRQIRRSQYHVRPAARRSPAKP